MIWPFESVCGLAGCSVKKHIKEFHETNKDNKRLNVLKQSFQCPQCPKMYSLESALRRHEKAIHKFLLYKCKPCDKTFNRRDSLNDHEKSQLHKQNIFAKN